MQMNLVTPQMLTKDQWAVLRDAPHLVVVAISASGGTRLDALLERAAGTRAIGDGQNNDHPLVRAIAVPAEMEIAMSSIEARTRDSRGSLRPPAELMQLATDSVRQAAEVLRSVGSELDLYGYREYVMGVARSVAEAARDDDFVGLGGRLVSDAERAVLASVSQALSS